MYAQEISWLRVFSQECWSAYCSGVGSMLGDYGQNEPAAASDDNLMSDAEAARRRGEVTELLQQMVEGRPSAGEILMPLVYEELRKIARGFMRRERSSHTLQPTALVHEAYLRMLGQKQVSWEGRGHFFSVAARMMRRILVDACRRRIRQKRGGGAPHEGLTASQIAGPNGEFEQIDVLALDEALERLGVQDRRMVQIVELRFFAGLTVEEIASALQISEPTVKRSWSVARAWLARELGTN